MSKDKLLPKLRFKKFVETGAWQKYLLEELVEVNNGKDYKHLEKGEIPVYGTGGYMTKVNAALSYEKDAIGIGRKGTIDKPYILKAPYWTVDTLFYVIPKFDSNINFFQSIFKNINWLSKQESTGVPSLSKSTINNIEILIPTIQEQQKIGSFFERIDKMIQLQQSKVNKVKDIKSAYLSEMFPKEGEKYPKKRFEGFTGPWIEYNLGKIGNLYQPQTISRTSLLATGVPVFGANGYIGYYSMSNHKKDQITISARGENAGNPSYVNGPVWITGNSMVVNIDENTNINKKYLYSYLSAQKLGKYITGGAQPQLTREVLNKVPIQVPSLSEQEKIGELFKNLDNQISIEEEKLTKLEKLKQAYLNDMFV